MRRISGYVNAGRGGTAASRLDRRRTATAANIEHHLTNVEGDAFEHELGEGFVPQFVDNEIGERRCLHLDAPRPLRPIINGAARRVANRFIPTYQRHSPHIIDSDTLAWYRSLQACRILVDLAGWRANDTTDSHRGHPWFAIEPALRPLLRP